MLFSYENSGNTSHRLRTLSRPHKIGAEMLIFDYRGYASSPSKASEKDTYLDAIAARDFLTRQRNIPAEKIVVYARSLGAAIAAHLAEEVRLGTFVIDI